MKEQVIKHYELIFSEVRFPETTFEEKMKQRQKSVQYLAKDDRFIYVKEGKQLVRPFYSPILMRVLNVLFVGPKPWFPQVLRDRDSITRDMLALVCILVSISE